MVPMWVLVHLRFPVWIVCFFSNQGKELTGRLLFQAFVVGEIIPVPEALDVLEAGILVNL